MVFAIQENQYYIPNILLQIQSDMPKVKNKIGSANEYDACVGNARAIEKQSFVSSLDNASTFATGHIE